MESGYDILVGFVRRWWKELGQAGDADGAERGEAVDVFLEHFATMISIAVVFPESCRFWKFLDSDSFV